MIITFKSNNILISSYFVITKLFWLKVEFRVLMKFDAENLPNSNYNTKSVKKSSIILLARKCDKYKQHIELIENGKFSLNIYNILNTLNTELFVRIFQKKNLKRMKKIKFLLTLLLKHYQNHLLR